MGGAIPFVKSQGKVDANGKKVTHKRKPGPNRVSGYHRLPACEKTGKPPVLHPSPHQDRPLLSVNLWGIGVSPVYKKKGATGIHLHVMKRPGAGNPRPWMVGEPPHRDAIPAKHRTPGPLPLFIDRILNTDKIFP